MKQQSKIPVFKTFQEEAEFWDTHSVTEFLPELRPVRVLYAPEKKPAKPHKPQQDIVIHLKISSKTKQLLDQKAKRQASTISALLRQWVNQKLAESAP